jgi:hypothetical protein
MGGRVRGGRLYDRRKAEPAVPASVWSDLATSWCAARPLGGVGLGSGPIWLKARHPGVGEVEWNSRLVRDDAEEEVARLKAQLGFDIDVGGPTTASTLMRLGLIDEYRLFVHPLLGAGTPFFPALARYSD